MRTRDFSFDLPSELIAQYPSDRRGESRLLVLDRSSGGMSHRMMGELPELLPHGALLVVNDSRVRKARLYGTVADTSEGDQVSRASGGGRDAPLRQHPSAREFLFVRRLESVTAGDTWLAMTKKPARLRRGARIAFPGGFFATVAGHTERFVELAFHVALDEEYFERNGHIPLPPYVRREDEPGDADRYQTVYASSPGSVAAPTAGLHLTEALLQRIEDRGIDIVHITLHVGIGTFLPVRSEWIDDHTMHEEEYQIGAEAAQRINRARAEGRPVVAVGTTSVRTLESAFDPHGGVVPGRRSTDLFIRPGYKFTVVDALMTNFHTPESTLLMLVAAFAGRERILKAYAEAVQMRYRFFSYGDAMLIL